MTQAEGNKLQGHIGWPEVKTIRLCVTRSHYLASWPKGQAKAAGYKVNTAWQKGYQATCYKVKTAWQEGEAKAT